MTPEERPARIRYAPSEIEAKWQAAWGGWVTSKSEKPKYYALFEFPYPSGDGLHVGHLRPYTGMDVIARKRRLEGYSVLFPVGWDAFGLPAERYAIKTGIHPAIVTKQNIANFTRQMKAMGYSFDWGREINTTDPSYYRWTQWMFIKFFEAGLAYKTKTTINWCPNDKIGLANEEVVAGCCERCGAEVVRMEKEQWMIRITAYAQQLLDGLEGLDFPEEIKASQRHWIGRKEGIEITYPVEGTDEKVTVFTTRPDTNFGATFVVLSPGNPLAKSITTPEQRSEVDAYILKTNGLSTQERVAAGRKKTGAFTGRYATNHLTGKQMPIWVSDFVLDEVGTGALVGVPGHDLRDFEFAKEFGLDVVRVVVGPDGDVSDITSPEQVQEAEGTMVNSDFLNGTEIREAILLMMDRIESEGWGKRTVSYRLRDWVFSRQRYWGEPIPLVHCGSCGYVPVPDADLPVVLPPVERYEPRDDGESPLASVAEWVNVSCPKCGGEAKRETDVMPNWAGSSWYFLRYVDPQNDEEFASRENLEHWMPVDWYNGGMEHVTLHLLYARFWNRFLFDQGYVPFAEPFKKRTAHGMILAFDGTKMSKSKGNVVTPDSVIERYGVDTLRVYEMFIGPFGQATTWNPQSIEGVHRFLSRVHAVAHEKEISASVENSALVRAAKRTAKKVGEDIETMAFNTAISALMIFSNEAVKAEAIPQEAWEVFLLALSPFAPHLAEELWAKLGKSSLISEASWPAVSASDVAEDTVRVTVQVNGKTYASIEVASAATEEEVSAAARSVEKVALRLGGEAPTRVIYVPGRIINFVL